MKKLLLLTFLLTFLVVAFSCKRSEADAITHQVNQIEATNNNYALLQDGNNRPVAAP